jgi:hypothetical protein
MRGKVTSEAFFQGGTVAQHEIKIGFYTPDRVTVLWILRSRNEEPAKEE